MSKPPTIMERDIAKMQAQLSPAGFASVASKGRWESTQHLQVMDDVLLELCDGNLKGAIVCMPPRHGKSELLSKYFPAWYLGRNPNNRVMLGSYEAKFAASWGRKARDVLSQVGRYYFGVRVRQDSHAANQWNLVGFDGGMDTAGVGGAFTGKGGHILIIDDPIKNAEDANSDAVRSKVWEWYLSTLETRLEPGGCVIVVQTRWHETDLAGRLEREIDAGIREGWKVINFPALAEEDDILGRSYGEALWPERYSAEYLNDLRTRLDHDEARIGPYWWDALYQQRPAPAKGEFFKRDWFRYYQAGMREGNRVLVHTGDTDKWYNDSNGLRVTTVDLATSEKDQADYTVISTWARNEQTGVNYLLDVDRRRVTGAEHLSMLKEAYARWQPHVIYIESVQYQQALVQQALAAGLPARKSTPRGDKEARATAFATLLEGELVRFPRWVSWLSDIEDELMKFPKGDHDDFVDTCSLFANEVVFTSKTAEVIF